MSAGLMLVLVCLQGCKQAQICCSQVNLLGASASDTALPVMNDHTDIEHGK